ncbi:hypothetical protein BP00DRAFT_450629, partial [Aspergillus indologenus CBS 114.80]
TTTTTTTTTTTPAPEPQSELNAAVDDLLDQLQHKFDGVSREIFGKYDMARRLDELEASLALLDSSSAGAPGATPGAGGGGGAGDGAGSPSPGK